MSTPQRPISRATSPQRQEQARRLSLEIAATLDETRCEDVVVLDVRGLSQVTDFIVIGSGSSDRQMRTAAQKSEDTVKELGETVFRTSRDTATTWIVLDCVDVVVHVFEPNARAMYDLEMLWGDAPKLDWAPRQRPQHGAFNREM